MNTSLNCRLDPNDHLVARGSDPGVDAQQLEDLSHRLVKLRKTRDLRTLLVTSSVPREGKTIVAVNLAIALARMGSRVVLVDADTEHAGVSRTLGLYLLQPGLSECLERNRHAGSSVWKLDPLNIYCLPAGCPTSHGNNIDAARIREAIDQLRGSFDWVVVDAPSLLNGRTHDYLTATDAVAMVVRAGITPNKQVLLGTAKLQGCFLAGVIFNGEEKSRADVSVAGFSSAFHLAS